MFVDDWGDWLALIMERIMKVKVFLGIAAVALVGCAGNQQAMERSIAVAESSRDVAQESALDSASLVKASANLDSAKAYQAAGESELAIGAAENSALEYRLAMVSAERDSLKRDDERVEKELRSDVERKLLYQNILDQETKGGK